ncbi:MAG TPA: hypothetical protein VNK41_09075 [Vicinamibacterales bacterium]|nr:hypothetical protein [Vicinamibacterales bacterium]
MRRIVGVAVAAAVTVAALAAAASGGSSASMTRAQAAGWDCSPIVLIGGYYHCAPPGKTSVAGLIAGTDVPTIELRVFHPDGTLAGTESLLRADLYAGQPCPQDHLEAWDLLPFGYYACHHFDT